MLNSPKLNQSTPQKTIPIEHFIVRLKDGTVKKVIVADGEGFFRVEEFKGTKGSFTTFECYVANGEIQDIHSGVIKK